GGTDSQVERKPGAPRGPVPRCSRLPPRFQVHCAHGPAPIAPTVLRALHGAASPRTIVSMLSNLGPGRRRSVLRAVLVAVALVAWLAVGGFGGMAQGEMSQVQENDQAAFLPESAESTQASRVIEKFSTSEDLPALLVIEATDGGGLSGEQIAAVQQFAGKIPQLQLDGGTEVSELLTSEQVHAIPCEVGKAVLVPIPMDAELASELIGGEEGATALVSTVRDAAPDALSEADLTSWVTGPAASIADLTSAFAGIDGILLLVALVVVLIILTVVYRSPLLPIAVIVTAVFALCLA